MSMKGLARRSGSPARAFESLYRRHVSEVYRYTLAMLDRPADAEDATQSTFLNAYRALENGERPRDAGPWLRTIALNVCREHYRRASRRPDEVSLDDDPGDLVLDPPTPEIGEVIKGLSHLPFNQRAALVMREFEGRSFAEIGDALEVSSSAVEALLFRARRALREQLEGTLSCADAERAISSQLDGALPRSERSQLRAHLRACGDCASLAKRLRAQRSAIRSLAVLPVPASLKLANLFGSAPAPADAAAATTTGMAAGGSLLASAGGSVGAKLAGATVAGMTAVGVGYATLHHRTSRPAASLRLASITDRRPASTGAHASVAGRGVSSGVTVASESGNVEGEMEFRSRRTPRQRIQFVLSGWGGRARGRPIVARLPSDGTRPARTSNDSSWLTAQSAGSEPRSGRGSGHDRWNRSTGTGSSEAHPGTGNGSGASGNRTEPGGNGDGIAKGHGRRTPGGHGRRTGATTATTTTATTTTAASAAARAESSTTTTTSTSVTTTTTRGKGHGKSRGKAIH